MKDFFGYKGKVAVVTGAASGMGKETAQALVELGADVYGLDRTEVNISGIKEFVEVDLSSKSSIDAAFDKLPKEIHSFFGVAGVSGQTTDFDVTFTINYIANKYITDKYLMERMQTDGAISYVTSAGGLGWDQPEFRKELEPVIATEGWDDTLDALNKLDFKEKTGVVGYLYSKRAMNYYIASVVPKFGEKKVRVNGVLPAGTVSGLTDEFVKGSGGMDNMVASAGFAGRLAESREMAEPLVFLNSNMASFISGVLLDVDYGQNIQTTSGMKEKSDLFNFKFLA